MKVGQYDNMGNIIDIYESMTKASKETKIPLTNIWKACNNQRSTAGDIGFWSYIN